MLERIDIKNLVNGAWNESNYIDRYNIYIERERAQKQKLERVDEIHPIKSCEPSLPFTWLIISTLKTYLVATPNATPMMQREEDFKTIKG